MKLKKLELPEPYNFILHYLVCLTNFFLQFELLDFEPCLRNHTLIFSETPFRSLKFGTYIVTIKNELYQNLGPLRWILKAPESKSQGGGRIYHPLCNVGLSRILSWKDIFDKFLIDLYYTMSTKISHFIFCQYLHQIQKVLKSASKDFKTVLSI